MLTITILLLILMTINLWTAFQSTVVPALQVNVLASNQNWLVLFNDAVCVAIRLIFDLVLIYRCWVIWDRSWRVTCIPLLLWIVCLTSAILALYYIQINAYTRSAKILFFSRTEWYRFEMLFYSCNIAINIYATTAIVYRIMRITGRAGNRGLRQICRILVESATPYTLTSAIILIADAVAQSKQSFGWEMLQSIAKDVNFSVASISFNLILIRVAQNREHPRRNDPAPKNANRIASSSRGSPLEDLSTTLGNTEQSSSQRTHDGMDGSA